MTGIEKKTWVHGYMAAIGAVDIGCDQLTNAQKNQIADRPTNHPIKNWFVSCVENEKS